MDLFQLEAFVTVVREGSFSKAAKALYPHAAGGQPDHSSGSRTRSGSRSSTARAAAGVLTDAGQVLLEHAERLMNFQRSGAGGARRRAAPAQRAAGDREQRADVPVSAAAARTNTGGSIPPCGCRSAAALASRIPADVRDYGADLGVVTYQPSDAGLESVVVYHDQLAFVVPRTHRVRQAAAGRASRISAASISSRITCRRRTAPRSSRRSASGG